MAQEFGLDVAARKGRTAGQERIERAAQGVNIGQRIGTAAHDGQLRSEVVGPLRKWSGSCVGTQVEGAGDEQRIDDELGEGRRVGG